MKTIPIAVTALVLSAVLAGCGSSGAKTDSHPQHNSSSMPSMSMSGSTSKAGGTTVTIKSFAFTVPASVAPGAKLSVTNDDSVAHTFTVKSANIDKNIAANGKATITAPKSAGTYAITCDFHPNMHGSLVVK